ncbi:MAG: STAS/SEC14 domain-containing protein [Spirochaetia bacterium]|nr:STAS/SEC14 domain-containing protein [Spirochaetia bacterium]
MKTNIENNTIITRTEKISLENNYIQIQILPDVEITLEDIKENEKAILKISHEKKYPILVDATMLRNITKEARFYSSDENNFTMIKALAVVAKSIFIQTLGNFFIGINKPNYPIKIFNSKEEALIWIKDYNELS